MTAPEASCEHVPPFRQGLVLHGSALEKEEYEFLDGKYWPGWSAATCDHRRSNVLYSRAYV